MAAQVPKVVEYQTEVGTMTVGSFKSYYVGWCDKCQKQWLPDELIYFNPGKRGYFCSPTCAGETNPPPAQDAPRQSSNAEEYCGQRQDEREQAMFNAHKENMESARLTRDAIIALTVAVSSLQKELSVLVTLWRDVQNKGG